MYFLYEWIIKKKKKYINAGEGGKFSHWPLDLIPAGLKSESVLVSKLKATDTHASVP